LKIPEKSGESVEIALDIPAEDEDKRLLQTHGWRITSPEQVTTVEGFRGWVLGSLGEFSCAKAVYAHTRSGWFSHRSGAYLAAGRPVIVEETGFSDLIPTGDGLFAFATCAEAVEAFHQVRSDYEHHSAAARKLAREYFDSDRVLASLLLRIGI